MLHKTAEGQVVAVVGHNCSQLIPYLEKDFDRVLVPDRDSSIPHEQWMGRVEDLVELVNGGGSVIAFGRDWTASTHMVCSMYQLSPRMLTNIILVTSIIPGEVWKQDTVLMQVLENLPTSIALMDIHLLNGKDEGVTKYFDLSDEAKSFINYVESYYEVQVVLVGTGSALINRGMDY